VDSSPTSCVLVLLIAIDVVVVVVPYAVSLPLLLYSRGEITRKVTESITT
jgi:hypothetical protein